MSDTTSSSFVRQDLVPERPARTIVVEIVFSLDGMGLYFLTALGANDPYPIMAWLMVTATMVIIFNLIADIAYGYLDPRVRYD